MRKRDIYQTLARNMGLEIDKKTMEEIDNLIDGVGQKAYDGLKNAFISMFYKNERKIGIADKHNIMKTARAKATPFRMQLRLLAEYYGDSWMFCKDSNTYANRVRYYLLHNLTSYLFDVVIPEKRPLYGKKLFVERINKGLLLGAWNSLKKDPEFKWIYPIYNNILDFLYSKIKLVDNLPLFCEKDNIALKSFTAYNVTFKFCPECGTMYIEKLGGEKK